jgi:hypothetical protein
VVWLKRAKIGEEPLNIKFSMAPSTFNKCKQKKTLHFREKEWNCHVFAYSRWAFLPPLLLADSGFLVVSHISFTL